ncbi:MBL fold metallo-hydrolase [Lacrimispora sp. 210928-DFI.3.58]|uniref:MBL fold metallo-hydrolase n=1 Tax=Lacrimispora sp. 210928-DFI.3.58 TaxID=2883214 RepID=UPI0015B418AA|nr:MBL fold metallo-hydrolase [Lacrimispora sp. 210928-DFI.3.58]MCB7317995.1 MBL fold metallo-hydrolase [Lacrimispora sp. 210928-DFI.3.58]
MQKRRSLTVMLAAAMAMSMPFTSLAGEWKANDTGWWWQEEDGSYPMNSWRWLDGNQDGISECYYFDETGYLVTAATTPDGYQVNADGAWTENGRVQSKEEEKEGSASMWGGNITVEAKQFTGNMYVLDEPRTRAYLIVGKDKALLIDTLMEDDHVLDEVRKITDLPVEVVLTHGHPDHIGGMVYFDSCCINERDAYLLPEGLDITYISEGDVISCGDFHFEIIEIPGHTYGSIALLDRSHGILITGDSVQEGPVVMFGDGVDMEAYINSMEKLMDYEDDVKYIFAGHHTYPSGSEYIRYAYEDAIAFVNGELPSTPMQAMGAVRNVYQGEHVSFLAD